MKKKLLSIVTTLSMVVGIGMVAHADTIPETGAKLVYNEALSNETSKVIDVIYVGENAAEGIYGYMLRFDVDLDLSNTADYTYAFSGANGLTLAEDANDKDLANGKIGWNADAADLVVAENSCIGTLTITVPATESNFDVAINTELTVIYDYNVEDVYSEESSITIPGATVEPEEPAKPAFESKTAEYLGRFDDDTKKVPVDAWSATIDWSEYEAAKALNWTLSVGGEEKTVAAATQTEITGEMTVIYGLAIAGRVDQLDTIDASNVVLK